MSWTPIVAADSLAFGGEEVGMGPELGQLVEVRRRRWVVSDVESSTVLPAYGASATSRQSRICSRTNRSTIAYGWCGRLNRQPSF